MVLGRRNDGCTVFHSFFASGSFFDEGAFASSDNLELDSIVLYFCLMAQPQLVVTNCWGVKPFAREWFDYSAWHSHRGQLTLTSLKSSVTLQHELILQKKTRLPQNSLPNVPSSMLADCCMLIQCVDLVGTGIDKNFRLVMSHLHVVPSRC